MILESLLAYAHLLAILALVVFISSEAALCRPEWMNAKIVERLVTVDRIYGIAAGVLFATGVVRVFFGGKGAEWYGGNWLLHVKVAAFVAVALISIRPTLRFSRWRRELRASGAMPSDAEVRQVRKWVMLQAHIIPVIPLAAVFMARGYGQ